MQYIGYIYDSPSDTSTAEFFFKKSEDDGTYGETPRPSFLTCLAGKNWFAQDFFYQKCDLWTFGMCDHSLPQKSYTELWLSIQFYGDLLNRWGVPVSVSVRHIQVINNNFVPSWRVNWQRRKTPKNVTLHKWVISIWSNYSDLTRPHPKR